MSADLHGLHRVRRGAPSPGDASRARGGQAGVGLRRAVTPLTGVLAAPLPLLCACLPGRRSDFRWAAGARGRVPSAGSAPRHPAQARGRPPRGAAAQAPWKAGASSPAWVSGQLGSHSVCTREPEGRRARASACSCHTRAVSPRVGRLRRPCGVALPGAGLGTRPLWLACSGRGCLRLRAPGELGPEWETRPCGSGLGARVRRAPGLD